MHDPLFCQEYLKEFQECYQLYASLCALHQGYGVTSCAASKVIQKKLTFFFMGHYLISLSSFQTHFQNLLSYEAHQFPLIKVDPYNTFSDYA